MTIAATKTDLWTEFETLDIVGTETAVRFVRELDALNERFNSSQLIPKSYALSRMWVPSGDLYSQILAGITQPKGPVIFIVRDAAHETAAALTQARPPLDGAEIHRVETLRIGRAGADPVLQCRIAEFESARPTKIRLVGEDVIHESQHRPLVASVGSRLLTHLLSGPFTSDGKFFQPEPYDLVMALALLQHTDPKSLAADWLHICRPQKVGLVFHGGDALLNAAIETIERVFIAQAQSNLKVIRETWPDVDLSMLEEAAEKMQDAVAELAIFECGEVAARAIDKANGKLNRLRSEYVEVHNLLGPPGTSESREFVPPDMSAAWAGYVEAAGKVVSWIRNHPAERADEIHVPNAVERVGSDFAEFVETVISAQDALGITDGRNTAFSNIVRGTREAAIRPPQLTVIEGGKQPVGR